MATKEDLRREIGELRHVGRQMANVCFNLGQNASPHDFGKMVSGANLTIMYDLSKQWDAIKRGEDRGSA